MQRFGTALLLAGFVVVAWSASDAAAQDPRPIGIGNRCLCWEMHKPRCHDWAMKNCGCGDLEVTQQSCEAAQDDLNRLLSEIENQEKRHRQAQNRADTIDVGGRDINYAR